MLGRAIHGSSACGGVRMILRCPSSWITAWVSGPEAPVRRGDGVVPCLLGISRGVTDGAPGSNVSGETSTDR